MKKTKYARQSGAPFSDDQALDLRRRLQNKDKHKKRYSGIIPEFNIDSLLPGVDIEPR